MNKIHATLESIHKWLFCIQCKETYDFISPLDISIIIALDVIVATHAAAIVVVMELMGGHIQTITMGVVEVDL